MSKKITLNEKNEEIVKGSSALPAHLAKYANLGNVGFENVRQEDITLPRLSIAQSISPQVQKDDPLQIKGLEVGQFFNTVTEQIYGETVRITPLFYFPSRILFPPRGSNEPERCRATKLDEDGRLIEGRITPEGCDACPHSVFRMQPDGSNRPDCTKFMNYICAIHRNDGRLEPIAWSVKSKMIKPTKRWNGKIRAEPLPGFCLYFDFATKAERASKGTFYNIVYSKAFTVDDEKAPKLEALFAHWSNVEFKIDTRGADTDEDSMFEENNANM